MRNGLNGRPKSYSRFRIGALVAGILVVCHLLSVVIISAQSTAAGGPLILFPLSLLWKGGFNGIKSHYLSNSGPEKDDSGLDGTKNFSSSGNSSVKQVIHLNGANGEISLWSTGSNSSKYDNHKEATIFPNPVRLPILPNSPPPPPGKRIRSNSEIPQNSFMQQLRNKRRDMEQKFAERHVSNEGISIQDAVRKSRVQNKEAIDSAVLEFEQPQNHVKRAFSGGQNGRSLPAPYLLSGLFKRERRDPDDKSWLDRVTDSLLDKLELNWEDDEEARSDERLDEPPLQIEDSEEEDDISAWEKAGTKRWPADECANALQIPKVAMMILTKGELFHSSTWKAWFEFAEGVLPLAQVKSICKNPTLLEKAKKACRRREKGTGEDILANQHLFNVYIHVGLNNQEFQGYAEDTIWHNREILDRVQVEWGRHSLVTATRNLMKVALQEPRNQRFILLSEAGIPLYPPTTLYYQLMIETKSRINSCTPDGWERHPHRWTDAMETDQMKEKHWRKSSQWFGLTRAHAELVIKDEVINRAFHDHCYPTTEDGRWRDCFSEEHYFATLLAVLGRENETDCKGFNMHVDWSRGGAHPRTYELREISAARLRLLRMPTEGCGYPSAIKTSQLQFLKVHEMEMDICDKDTPEYSNTLGPQCPLLARKFAPETASAITKLMSECKNRLKILHSSECITRLRALKMY